MGEVLAGENKEVIGAYSGKVDELQTNISTNTQLEVEEGLVGKYVEEEEAVSFEIDDGSERYSDVFRYSIYEISV